MSYADRVIWKNNGSCKVDGLKYGCLIKENLLGSDHQPVYCEFNVHFGDDKKCAKGCGPSPALHNWREGVDKVAESAFAKGFQKLGKGEFFEKAINGFKKFFGRQ